MTRIIAGIAGGRRLAVPPGKGTRPTSDRAREGIFSTVGSLIGSLDGARVLDLYAGSGAIGLEALSRGADHALLVESDQRAARTIRENMRTLGLAGAVLVVDRVERVLARRPEPSERITGPEPSERITGIKPSERITGMEPSGCVPGVEPYDFVFADPPYAVGERGVIEVLERLRDGGWLAPDALIAIERESRGDDLKWPKGYEEERVRRYGEAAVWYGRAARNP